MDSTVEITPKLHAYLAKPQDDVEHPALIIIHEIWGLNDNIKDIARRFAEQGYISLAPDLLAGTELGKIVTPELIADMQDPEKRDEAQKKMRAALAPAQTPEFANETIQKLEECFQFLKNHPGVNGKVGVVGFCFGGTYSFSLSADQSDLSAAVPFYGHAPEKEEIEKINCPVLSFYGEQDSALIDTLPKLKETMSELGKDFEAVVYPNTGHAFFNDTNLQRYNKEAAEDSWKKTLIFLTKHL